MKTHLITALFSLILLQATTGQELTYVEFPLVHGDEYLNIAGQMRILQYMEEGGERFLYVSDIVRNRTIFVYKFGKDGPKYLKKILIAEEGPNAVEGYIVGVFVKNSDEIYLEVGQGSSYVINGRSERLKYKSYSRDWEDGALVDAFAFILPTNPGYVIGDMVSFTSCMTSGWNLRNIGYLVDMESLETESIINIKELNTNWYGSSLPMITHYFCVKDNSMYLSLPYDHTIFKFDEDKNIVARIDVKSDLLGRINPVAKEKTEMSSFRAYEHAATNGFYGPLISNSFTSNFYRFVYAPVKNYTKEADAFKNRYLEVYDSEWNLLDQFKVPKKYRGDNVFASPDGLCFLDSDKSEKSEDVLTFDCLKF